MNFGYLFADVSLCGSMQERYAFALLMLWAFLRLYMHHVPITISQLLEAIPNTNRWLQIESLLYTTITGGSLGQPACALV